MTTYSDLLDAIVRVVYGHGLSAAADQVRMAASMAFEQLPMLARWNRYRAYTRLLVNNQVVGRANYSDGTLTLDSGEWPSWAVGCSVMVSNYRCMIASIAGNVATLSVRPSTATSGDVSYALYHDCLDLPADFIVVDSIHSYDPPYQLEPGDRSEVYRDYGPQMPAALPARFTIEPGVANYRLRLFPPPCQRAQLDLIYWRRIKMPVHSGRDAITSRGTIDVTGTSVAGNGTSFRPDMVGAVLRVGDAERIPTGLDGLSPYVAESLIEDVIDTDSMTLVRDVGDFSDVRYCITDVLDIDPHMFFLLMALSMQSLSQILGKKIAVDVDVALREAKAADARQAGIYGGADQGTVRTVYLTSRIGQ